MRSEPVPRWQQLSGSYGYRAGFSVELNLASLWLFLSFAVGSGISAPHVWMVSRGPTWPQSFILLRASRGSGYHLPLQSMAWPLPSCPPTPGSLFPKYPVSLLGACFLPLSVSSYLDYFPSFVFFCFYLGALSPNSWEECLRHSCIAFILF